MDDKNLTTEAKEIKPKKSKLLIALIFSNIIFVSFVATMILLLFKDSVDENQGNDDSYQQEATQLINHLKYIANSEYKDIKGIDDDQTYINDISSIEFYNDTFSYISVKNDEVLSVEIKYSFSTLNDCISLINENYSKKNFFNINSSIASSVSDTAIKDKFINYYSSLVSEFYVENLCRFDVYSCKNPNEAFISFIYKSDKQTYICNTNVDFNVSKDTFSIGQECTVNYLENKTLYFVIESLVKQQ